MMSSKLPGRALGDVPEPKPLHDPLLAARPWLWSILILSLVVCLWRFLPDAPLFVWIFLGVNFSILVLFIYALPKKPVSALYLRAFGEDDATFDARLLIEATIHPKLRLAGIREPRRRMLIFLRPFLLGVLALRYIGARYMSLEAESDWLARLWKTLSTVRVVFVDLRKITDSVVMEIKLAQRCVGLERLIFITDPKERDNSIDEVSKITGLDRTLVAERTVDWIGIEQNEIETFCSSIANLIDQLPAQPADLNRGAFELVCEYALDRAQTRNRRLIEGAQWALGLLVVLLFQVIDPEIIGGIFPLVFETTIGRIIVGSAIGFVLVPVSVAIYSMLRRNPLQRAVRKRSRSVLLRSTVSTTRTIVIASLGVGIAFQLSLELLSSQMEKNLRFARIQQTKVEILRLGHSLSMYQLDHGKYPDSLDKIEDPGIRSRVDPWGNSYEYTLDASGPRVWSRGPDGLPNSQDDIYHDDIY